MTALRKEPGRRYASAEDFAHDIELHLEDLPIRAQKDSLFYRADKFGRRNSAQLVTVSLVFIAIVASITSRMWQARPATESTQPSVRIRPAVAVLGFRNLSHDAANSWISAGLSEILNRTLSAGGQFRTVRTEFVAKSKIDLGISDAEVLDRSLSSRLRSVLDTDYNILGSYSVVSGETRLDIRTQDRRTGETAATASEKASGSALVDLAVRAGVHLRQRLGIGDLSSAELQSLAASFPAAPEAMRDYAEGLEKMSLLEAEGAKTALLKGLAKDPGHALSHDALSDAWSMLGYESRAADEAKKAADLSGPLSRPDQLAIEARYDETTHQKPKPLELYRNLFQLFPDD